MTSLTGEVAHLMAALVGRREQLKLRRDRLETRRRRFEALRARLVERHQLVAQLPRTATAERDALFELIGRRAQQLETRWKRLDELVAEDARAAEQLNAECRALTAAAAGDLLASGGSRRTEA